MATEGNTVMNALVGAIVTVVLSILPLSPILGGSVAGYLENGPRYDGAKAGCVSGVFAAIPLFLGSIVVVPLVVIAPLGVPVLPGGPILFVFGLTAVVGAYAVGFGTLGGVVGAYLAHAWREE